MSRVGFYQLSRTGVEAALAPLLLKTLEAGERALVLCGDAARVAALDAALWAVADWLPHGTAAMGFAEAQPVWITEALDGVAPNGARFLFLLDGRLAALEGFARAFDVFEAARVEAARARYAAAKAAGHAMEYWRQGARGWERAG